MKNKLGMILIIVLLVVLLILFAVGFTFLYKAMNKTEEAPVNEVVVEETLPLSDIINFPIGDPIITNLLEGPDQKRHVIKISVSLGINNSKKVSKETAKLTPVLEAQKPVIKDIIIGVCRSKTFEELNQTDARAVLKQEILLKLQEAFDTELIVEAYIDDIFID